MLFVNEAVRTLHEQVADAASIDALFEGCCGHKLGPLHTADLIGLDTVLHSLEVLNDAFEDGRFKPCELLREMVAAGRLGMKSGEGFYEYR